MNAKITLNILDAEGLSCFQALQSDAVNAVTEQVYIQHSALYERLGANAKEACREDLQFHLEFLRPVLEFGLLQPMVDYLQWLNNVLTSRAIPTEHLNQSLDWLAEFFAQHMEPPHGPIVVAALEAARLQFQVEATTPSLPRIAREPWAEMAEFEAALLAGSHGDAYAILSRCMEQGKTLVEIELHIIQPALYEIGEKWQTNQVSVAQEHLATAIAQSLMSVALQYSHPMPLVNKRVLLACVEGNNHAVGLQMVADAFLLAGWDVQYLGANVPSSALITQAAEWKPDLIGLSVSFPQQIRIAKTLIKQLSEYFGNERPAVMIGGLAFNRFKGLAGVVGADTFSIDSQTAVELANSVVN
jgi:methanogenic corrinoid protein MtbC1